MPLPPLPPGFTLDTPQSGIGRPVIRKGAPEQSKTVQNGYVIDPNTATAVPVKGLPPEAADDEPGLDPTAASFYAQQILAGGQMPALGMGKSAAKARQQIMEQVAKTAGAQGLSGTDLAKQVAHYKAGQKQVGTLENQIGTTEQNEQTALLNGQQFIDRSTELPGQTQLPIINSLVQMAQRNLPVPGHETIAAMDAAWNTFVNEYAKVVSGTPSGGGTLSDSARHEAMRTMQGNYSLSQKQAAFAQMKADMANRLTAMNGTIDQAYENITNQPGHRNDAAIAWLPGNPAPTDNGITQSNPLPSGGPSGPAPLALSGSSQAVVNPQLAKIAPALTNYLNAPVKGKGAVSNAQIIGFMRKNGVDPTSTNLGQLLQMRATGKYKGFTVDPRSSVPLAGMDKARAELGASPGGALAIHAGNAATAGLVGPLTGTTDTMNTALAATSATNPTASLLGDVGGSALPMAGGEAALARAGMQGGMLRSALANAGYGAVAGGTQDGAAGAGMGALAGAAGGVAGEKLTSGLGAVLKGVTDPATRYVADRGVPLTIGQAVGGKLKGLEDSLSGIRIVGDTMNARRLEGLQKMNSKAFDRALEPIGGNAGGKFGEEAVADAQDQVGQAFDRALQGKSAQLDRPFIVAGAKAKMALDKLPDSSAAEVEKLVDGVMHDHFKAGQITGENLQSALRELADLKSKYADNPAGHRIGKVLDEFSGSLEDLFDRQAPDVMPQYKAAKKAQQRLYTLQDAVLRAKNESKNGNAVFTTGQLGLADRSNTIAFGGKNKSASGGGEFHDFQRKMQEVLPNKIPDSGSAGRLLVPLALIGAGGGGGALEGDTHTGLTLGAMLALAYSKPGQRALTASVLKRGTALRAAGGAVQKSARAIGHGAAGAAALGSGHD